MSNNYGRAALLNVTYKILSYCFWIELSPLRKNIIGNYLLINGFRGSKYAIEQIFIINHYYKTLVNSYTIVYNHN